MDIRKTNIYGKCFLYMPHAWATLVIEKERENEIVIYNNILV